MNEDEEMFQAAEKISQELIGTCSSILAEYEPYFNNKKFCEHFDELAFQCEDCGWWCAAEESNDTIGGFCCDECNDDGYEEYEDEDDGDIEEDVDDEPDV